MTRKCRQCRWCRRSFPLKVEVKKKGREPSPWVTPFTWTVSHRQGVFTCLHHLHHRHLNMCGGRWFGRRLGPDCMPNEYEIRGIQVTAHNAPECRQNGGEGVWNILRTIPRVFLVIIVSPRRNIGTHLNNYVGIPTVVFWIHLEILKEITK